MPITDVLAFPNKITNQNTDSPTEARLPGQQADDKKENSKITSLSREEDTQVFDQQIWPECPSEFAIWFYRMLDNSLSLFTGSKL